MNWADIWQKVAAGVLVAICVVGIGYTTTRASEEDLVAVALQHEKDMSKIALKHETTDEVIVAIRIMLGRIDERVKDVWDKANE